MKKKFTLQPKNYLFTGIVLAVLIVYTLFMFSILYFTISTSLKFNPDFIAEPIGFSKPYFQNYSNAFSSFFQIVKNGSRIVYLDEMLLYSLVYALSCSLTQMIVTSVVAYLVAKYRVWLNQIVYGTVIVAMVLPIVGSLPSEIQLMKALGLYNTLFGPAIMRASYLGMYFLVFYGTFKGLSDEYMEAATIDGAGQFTVMLKVVFPLVKTSMFAVFVLLFIGYWNDYSTPLIYMFDYPTAAVGLFNFVYNPSQSGTATIPLRMAGCMILFLPIFVLFLCFKNIFMGNLTVGGLKG